MSGVSDLGIFDLTPQVGLFRMHGFSIFLIQEGFGNSGRCTSSQGLGFRFRV